MTNPCPPTRQRKSRSRSLTPPGPGHPHHSGSETKTSSNTSRVILTALVSLLLMAAGPSYGDLNVTWIERTPHYDYDATKNSPAPGDLVTFHAHVINWSTSETWSPGYEWAIDEGTVETGTITDLTPGEERVLTFDWSFQSGNHTVTFTVDPDELIAESSELNNSITDRTNALIAGFWVEQSVYDYFHDHQHELGVGANSWEDWAQRQMARHNQLCENAIWDNTPQGVLDRVRVGKITVVADGTLPLNGGLPSNHPDTSDKTVDLMWGFPATLLDGTLYTDTTTVSDNNAFYLEQSLIHELGHARYLIDCYGFDVHNTAHNGGYDAVQIYEDGTYVAGSEYMPFLAWGEVLYYNHSGGVMSGPYGFHWSPYEAGALNLITGQRACCGNYNSPGNIGVYLQDLPQNNHLRIMDTAGQPRLGANVRIYNAEPAAGIWYGKTFDDTYDQEYTSDVNGYIHLPRNPFNPGGTIAHTYANANGVMILRVEHDGQLWYRFMEVSDFNMAYWAGDTQDAYYELELEGTNPSDSTPPSIPQNLSLDSLTLNEATLSWSASTDAMGVTGYRVFRDSGSIGTTAGTAYTDTGISSCGSYTWTVTALDAAANESAQSDPVHGTTGPAPQSPDLAPDGMVDEADLALMAGNWLDNGCDIIGDIDASGTVDLLDFAALAADWSLPDTEAPSVPTGLSVDNTTTSTIELSWSSATDDTGVAGYRVFRDGGSVGTTTATAYTDTGLTMETTYTYTVTAFDAIANESTASAPLVATTDSGSSPDPDLLGYWPFDHGTGSTAYDASTNGNNGTINGPSWTTTAQNGTHALDFDGSDDYVSLGTLDLAGSACTLAAWIRPDALTTDHRFISKADGVMQDNHYWMLSNASGSGDVARFRLKTGTTTSTLIADSGTLTAGTWTHLAATYDGNTMRLWKDGDPVGSLAKTGTIATNSSVNTWIGANPDASNYSDGIIDEVRIYTRALSESEIETLMGH